MSIAATGKTPVMNKDSADAIELLDTSDLQLSISGTNMPYARGWYEPGLGWVHEIVYPAEGRIDRWENGRQVPA